MTTELPSTLCLEFAGAANAGVYCWSWMIYDWQKEFAEDAGIADSKVEHTSIYPTIVGLGQGLRWLQGKEWKGKLIVRGLKAKDIFKQVQPYPILMKRVNQLLDGIEWTTEKTDAGDNTVLQRLLDRVYREYRGKAC